MDLANFLIQLLNSVQYGLLLFMMMKIADIPLKDINGKETSLKEYQGKVLLVVNVASECGYTYQYEGLQSLYMKYKDRGLVVAGFPANNFGEQEPGDDVEIGAFCKSKFGVTFPMFSKLSVAGADQAPLYQYLTSKAANPTKRHSASTCTDSMSGYAHCDSWIVTLHGVSPNHLT